MKPRRLQSEADIPQQIVENIVLVIQLRQQLIKNGFLVVENFLVNMSLVTAFINQHMKHIYSAFFLRVLVDIKTIQLSFSLAIQGKTQSILYTTGTKSDRYLFAGFNICFLYVLLLLISNSFAIYVSIILKLIDKTWTWLSKSEGRVHLVQYLH